MDSHRRIRHEARDSLTGAAVSLAGSVVTAATLWVLLAWLG
ncbi:MAG: hypothetical protein ACLGIF_03225 [Actinomycetes bacterium]